MKKIISLFLSSVLIVSAFFVTTSADAEVLSFDSAEIIVDSDSIYGADGVNGISFSDGILTLENVHLNGKIKINSRELKINVIGKNEIVGTDTVPLSAPENSVEICGDGELYLKYTTVNTNDFGLGGFSSGGAAVIAGDLTLSESVTVCAETNYSNWNVVCVMKKVRSDYYDDGTLTVSDKAKLLVTAKDGSNGISAYNFKMKGGTVISEVQKGTAVSISDKIEVSDDGYLLASGGERGIYSSRELSISSGGVVEASGSDYGVMIDKYKLNGGVCNIENGTLSCSMSPDGKSESGIVGAGLYVGGVLNVKSGGRISVLHADIGIDVTGDEYSFEKTSDSGGIFISEGADVTCGKDCVVGTRSRILSIDGSFDSSASDYAFLTYTSSDYICGVYLSDSVICEYPKNYNYKKVTVYEMPCNAPYISGTPIRNAKFSGSPDISAGAGFAFTETELK